MSKKKKKDKINRRDFIKKSAAVTIPSLAIMGLTLTGCPEISIGDNSGSSGCEVCSGTCQTFCTTACTNTCEDACLLVCTSCTASCSIGCGGTCSSNCSTACSLACSATSY